MSRSRRPASVLPFHGRKGWHGRATPKATRARWITPIMVVLPLAAFTAVFTWDGPPPGVAMPFAATGAGGDRDRERASFGSCLGPVRTDCVVDGDTFWYGGQKIRIADINTPEVGEPRCAAEAELGAKATRRLTALLNAGAFTLERTGRDTDKYGRALRIVTRDGESVGETLVDEGLAERWQGYRGEWC